MVGLWLSKRWAEYLTLVATAAWSPSRSTSCPQGQCVQGIDAGHQLAILVYLLLAKRLFGLRGGHRVQLSAHDEFGGWGAIERTTPAMSPSAALDAVTTGAECDARRFGVWPGCQAGW